MIGIIFDFDGTIIDSRSIASHALNKTWEQFLPNYDLPNISDIPLYDTKRMINVLLAKGNIELSRERTFEIICGYSTYLKELESAYILNEDICYILKRLKKNQNCVTAIISNRREESLHYLLNIYGIKSLFSHIYGSDTIKPKPDITTILDFQSKTSIESGKIIYIGDQDIDYVFASNADLIYYHAGYSSEPTNIAHKRASLVFSSTKQMKDLFNNIEVASNNVDETNKLMSIINEQEFCLFLGAGISIPSGYGSWVDSYKVIFDKIGISHLFDENNMTSVLQLMAFDENYNHKLFNEFKEHFSSKKNYEPNAYHYLSINANAKRIWTTNYDHLFEKIILSNHLDVTVIRNDDDLANNNNKNQIIKMNGDFESAHFDENLDWNIIFLKEQFDLYELRNPGIVALFERDFINSTIIFIGYSLTDPSLQRIIAKVKHGKFKQNCYHYICIVTSKDLKQQYLQKLRAKELRQYGIIVLFFGEYDSVLEFLKNIVIQNKQMRIGISGSIPDYLNEDGYYQNSMFTVKKTADICNKLGKMLSLNNYIVSSGGAPSVGIPAVEGAFDINSNNALFFFRRHGGTYFKCNAPAKIIKSEDIEDMRREFIKYVDVLVVISGRIVKDDAGIMQEIMFALDKSIPVLIFTQFGGQAFECYDSFIKNIEKYYHSNIICKQIKTLNEKINTLHKEDAETYLMNDFIDDLHELLTLCKSHQVIKDEM